MFISRRGYYKIQITCSLVKDRVDVKGFQYAIVFGVSDVCICSFGSLFKSYEAIEGK